MEMHFFNGLAVRLRFRLRHYAENLQGELAGMRREGAAVQDGGNVRQIAVHMGMMVFMSMMMLVLMPVLMAVPVMMLMFVDLVRMLVFERFVVVMLMVMFMFQLDVERTGIDAVGIGAGDRDGVAIHVQAVEGGQQFDF